jgi:hypothetical protein
MKKSLAWLAFAVCAMAFLTVIALVAMHDRTNKKSSIPAPVAASKTWTGYPVEIRTMHDDLHEVTCWYATGGYGGGSPAISCLPDAWLSSTGPKVQP